MTMNTTNYGYPHSGYSSPYSSTPSGIRTQRPRFGFSGSSLYPRSRSSASNSNLVSFSDSMINNYGTSTSRIDSSFNTENRNSFNDSYNTSGSNYYSANESFSHGQSYGEASMMHDELLRDDACLIRNTSMMHGYSGGGYSDMRSVPYSDIQNPSILPKPTSQLNAPVYNYNSAHNMNNVGEFRGNFQKKSVKSNKPYFTRKFGKAKRMATELRAWKCELCGIDFTSQIPYDMHLRGAKHAKKIKAKQALAVVQLQAVQSTGPEDQQTFFCVLCNVKANSPLQLQTHLDGSKHKSKLQPKETSLQSQSQEASKQSADAATVNGKTNGSLIRTLPPDFGEPQPAKIAKFACDICSITVNSETQLQQHLSSKKHQNKVEGKPVIKGKKIKENCITSETDAAQNTTVEQASNETQHTVVEQASNETSTKIIGVKTLASSFVQGETLQ